MKSNEANLQYYFGGINYKTTRHIIFIIPIFSVTSHLVNLKYINKSEAKDRLI